MKPLSTRWLSVLSVILIVAAAMFATSPAPTLAAERAENAPMLPAPTWFSCVHVIRSGETLFSIALLHGTSPFMLASMNGMSNFSFIFVGIVLRVPCVIAFPSPVFQPVIFQPQPFSNICNIHFVQRGEWVKLIAARFGVAWQVIWAVNRLPNPNLVFPGERLLIPCSSGANPYSPGMNPYGNGLNPYAPGMNPYAQPAPTSGQGTNVTIQDFMFAPATLMVHAGQTVMWRNNGPSQHTTTSDTGAWNSGTLGVGATFSHTFNSSGTFPFHCAIHPFMHGTVVVTP
jgi:plastocyanin